MSIQLQLRRGTSSQNDTFVGASGEVTVDTTNNTLRVHDGETVGGAPLVNESRILEILSIIYPVGSIYIGTQSTCPMATVISGSIWELVSSGKALWTGDGSNANTTIAAGLPNITAGLNGVATNGASASGAATLSGGSDLSYTGGGSAAYWLSKNTYTINASTQNSIYGNSDTVQPPAYVVNVWRRTA